MAGDRFLAVCHPISSPRFRTPLVSKIVSAVAWCTSAVIMLPVMIYSTTIKRDDLKMTCNMIWGDSEFTNSTEDSYDESDGTTFIWYTLILGFAIPLRFVFAALIFYILILKQTLVCFFRILWFLGFYEFLRVLWFVSSLLKLFLSLLRFLGLNAYGIHFICFQSDINFLLFGSAETEECRTENQIQGKEAIS